MAEPIDAGILRAATAVNGTVPRVDLLALCDEVDRLQRASTPRRSLSCGKATDVADVTYTEHVRDNVGSQASNPEAARLKVYCLTLCDLLERSAGEVDRLRAVVEAAEEVWRCKRCGGGGIIAPGSSCQTCAGDGVRVEWADDGSDLRPLIDALAALEADRG